MGYCLKRLENFFARYAVPIFRDRPSPVKLNFYDIICILIISFVSVITRFWAFYKPYGIISIEIPNQFYMKNQKKHADNSFSQPLGNIFYSFFATISLNYDGCDEYDDFECAKTRTISNILKTSQNYTENNILNFLNEDNQVTLRAISSLFSSFIPLFLFMSIKFASFSRICSFLSSFLIIFETSMLCEERFSLTSSLNHFFVSLSLCFLTYWFSLFRDNEKWKKFMLISSVFIGITVSVKSSAYFLIFIVCFHEFIYLFIENDSKLSRQFFTLVLKRYATFIIPIITIHSFFSFLQMILIFHNFQFTYSNFQRQISTNKNLFLQTFRLILTNCVNSRNKIQQSSPDLKDKSQSNHKSPASLIFVSKPDGALWTKCNKKGECERIIFIGNLFVYIFAFVGVILTILLKNNRKYFRSSTFYFGYLFSFIPFCFLNKYNYNIDSSDYIIPLMFGVACFGIAIDITVNRIMKGFLTVIIIIIAYIGFNLWNPFVFANKISKYKFNLRIWPETWRQIFGN